VISIRGRFRHLHALVAGMLGLGFVSGPLRPCPTHPDHAGHAPGTYLAAGTADGHGGHGPPSLLDAGITPETPSEHGPQAGCDCLGLCHVESAPLASLASTTAPVVDPDRGEPFRPASAAEPTAAPLYSLPLARPPPSVG